MKSFRILSAAFLALAFLAALPARAQFVMGPTTKSALASVTQATNRTTGVTINAQTGAITTNNTSLAALAAATFTVTNNQVAIGDVITVSIRSGAVNVKTDVRVTAVAAGSFNLTVHNIDASTAETGTIVINFAVVKRVLSG